MENTKNRVKLDEKSRPRFIIELPPANGQEGQEFVFDPLEVSLKLVEEGILDSDGNLAVSLRKAVEIFRGAIGLPSLHFSDALKVFIAFEKHMDLLEKKLDWLPTLPPSTDGRQPEDSAQKESQTETSASACG